jgi:hypothetical protein
MTDRVVRERRRRPLPLLRLDRPPEVLTESVARLDDA